MLTKQLIAFNHGKVYATLENPVVPTGSREKLLRALTTELSRFGYILSNDAILYLSEEDAQNIYAEIIPHLIELYHQGENFVCLFPGFPTEVINMSEEEYRRIQNDIYNDTLSIDDFISSRTSWYKEEEIDRVQLLSGNILNVLKPISPSSFMGIPQSIMKAGNSITEITREELIWFLENYPDLEIPENIPFKETMCVVMSMRDSYSPKDINDVLRFGMYLLGASPALETVPKKLTNVQTRLRKRGVHKVKTDNPEWRKLSSLPRSKRKSILKYLEAIITKKGVEASIMDAKRFYGHWVLLSERVHSGDYASQFPQSARFFTLLQTREISKDIRTWNSKVQKLYDSGSDITDITKFVSSRPGELVRRFDSLIRRAKKTGEEESVMDVFLETEGMKNKTLLELLNYYDRRLSGSPRMISVKGSRVKKVIPAVESIPAELVDFIQDVIARKILINIDTRIEEKDLSGKSVYIDPLLHNLPVPTDMRNRTDVIPAGYRIPITGGDRIRFFVHWIQKGTQEDLDLHTKFLSSDCILKESVGFNSSKSISMWTAFSGDVLNREGDCAEYVDIDLSKVPDDIRYATVLVNNYKGSGFDTLPCWLGYSVIPELENDNRLWKPVDVQYNQKITSTCTHIAAFVVDLKYREIIFIDADINSLPGHFNEFESVTKYYTTEHKFSTYEVVAQHYKSRGATIVDVLPDDAEERKEMTKILAEDLVKDYTSVLEIIGE